NPPAQETLDRLGFLCHKALQYLDFARGQQLDAEQHAVHIVVREGPPLRNFMRLFNLSSPNAEIGRTDSPRFFVYGEFQRGQEIRHHGLSSPNAASDALLFERQVWGVLYREAVRQHSPGLRSAPWDGITRAQPHPEGL